MRKKRDRPALLLIDVINDLNFPEADSFLRHGIPASKNILRLRKYCHSVEIPVIYVNDNFGIWRSDFANVVKHCTSKKSKGSGISKLLVPSENDYFVLKPKHSGFYCTTLDPLLEYLNCQTLILCGFAGSICVLFTANDAYMREYKIIVPSDCVASNTKRENDWALSQMSNLLKADTMSSSALLKRNTFSGRA